MTDEALRRLMGKEVGLSRLNNGRLHAVRRSERNVYSVLEVASRD